MSRLLTILILLSLIVLPFPTAPRPVQAATVELFFSEYIEGSSNNKALEIYNDTGASINLLTGAYDVYICSLRQQPSRRPSPSPAAWRMAMST